MSTRQSSNSPRDNKYHYDSPREKSSYDTPSKYNTSKDINTISSKYKDSKLSTISYNKPLKLE